MAMILVADVGGFKKETSLRQREPSVIQLQNFL